MKVKPAEGEVTDENVTEDTDVSTAMASLHPNSKPIDGDPRLKVEYITKMIGAMHAMKKEDLTKWYDQSMALIGKEASGLPAGANDEKNMSTVNMKAGGSPSAKDPMVKIANITPGQAVREDVDEMFVGSDLSEEFKTKAAVVFEAAVNLKATEAVARLEEEYESKLDEAVAELSEDMTKKLDTYLDYVVEEWMKENEIAIESSLRSELMDEFIAGLKNLFTEHHISIPEDKVDVVEALTAKVEALESQLTEAITETVELKRGATELKRKELVTTVAEGLTAVETEKFTKLAEAVEFTDLDAYKTKLAAIKESYFKTKKPVAAPGASVEGEVFEEVDSGKTVVRDANVNRYVQAISRTVKS